MTEFPALERLEKLATEMSQRAQGLQDLTDELNQIEVTVTEADGNVQVTAGAGGHITNVGLDPRAMRMESEELGRAITRACRKAVETYEDRVAEAMSGMMGESGELGDYMRRNLAERQAAREEARSEAESRQDAQPEQGRFVWGQDDDAGW